MDVDEDEGAWDLGDEDLDVGEELPEEVEQGEISSSAQEAETAIWIKNSKLPAVLIAAGAFDAAAQASFEQTSRCCQTRTIKEIFH